MNFLLIAVSVSLFVNQVFSQCRDDCYDQIHSGQCFLMKSFCGTNEHVANTLCRKTCGKCTSCIVPRLSSTCEIGCRDYYAPIVCLLFKARTHGCIYASRFCRATCGLCQGCKLPPGELECTKDCENTNENCAYWKKRKYCTNKAFPHVKVVCPLSCGICKPCPTQEPNTALPPTKLEDEAKLANGQ